MVDGYFIPYFVFQEIYQKIEEAKGYNDNGNTSKCGDVLNELLFKLDNLDGE